MLFGVSDEITDMMRSSRMVRTKDSYIGWYGLAKGSGPWGYKSVQKEFCGSQGAKRRRPWRLAPGLRKTSFCAFQKPCGLSPLAQIKCSHTQTFRETSGTPSSEFWNPSGVQTLLSHIKLYLRTIPEFLVMSMISSGTPNNIRSPTYITHIILYHQRTLSVRTLWVRELCRPDRDTSLVNNQERNLDSHIGSYIFYEDLYWSNLMTTYVIPFVHRYVTCPRFHRRYLHT